jgi:fucose 4-O-acetylase-like acetyltransferase
MRQVWVNYAKGIGIILVVFGHVNRGLYSAGISFSESGYQLLDSVIYTFHMPLFFFLSGLFFVQSIERKGKAQFIVSKIDTLVYPYIIWSLLQGMVEVTLSRYTNNPSNMSDVFTLFTQPRAQFWFLYALFMVFVVATLLYNRNRFNLILPLLIVASTLLYVYSQTLGNAFHINFVTRFMLFFLLGALAMRYAEQITTMGFAAVICSLLAFVAIEWLFHAYLHQNYTNTGWLSLLVAVVAITFIVCVSVVLAKLEWHWLCRLGELSMVIYLMHILAGSGLRIILSKILHVNSWSLHVVAGTLFGLIAPVIAYYLIRRWHLMFLIESPKSLWSQPKPQGTK